MSRRALVALSLVLLSGCAAVSRSSASPAAYDLSVAAAEPPPRPLERSLFEQRGSSGLSEEDIGRILDAPLNLQLPARIGVTALGEPFRPVAPEGIETGLAATRALEGALEDTRLVTIATGVARQLPTGNGIEGLRELAARYRTPYLLLYTERFEDRSRGNGWSALWLTVIGGLLSPSRTLAGEGLLEVSLFDVRTGTILFTVQQHVGFEETHLPIGAEGAWQAMRRKAAEGASKALAEQVVAKLRRLAGANATPDARSENQA